MIKLHIFNSGEKYNYKTKSDALRDIKGNRLRFYEFSLVDTVKGLRYYKGIWLNKKEVELARSGYNVKQIKIFRRRKK